MLNSTQLRQVVTEARPIIERMLNDATALAGLRDVVAAAGGDWSQLKALLKAQIQDEEAGEDKRVRKVLEKAEYATAYADMLGIGGNLNDGNISADNPRASRNGVDGTSEGQGATGAGTEGANPSTGSKIEVAA